MRQTDSEGEAALGVGKNTKKKQRENRVAEVTKEQISLFTLESVSDTGGKKEDDETDA